MFSTPTPTPVTSLIQLVLSALLMTTLGCPKPMASPAEPPIVPTDVGIDTIVEGFMADRGVVGLGLGISVDNEIAYLRGYGFADRDAQPPVPVDPKSTRFRWASISKTLTAVAALSLADAGHLDLDATVSSVFPTYVTPSSVGTIGGGTAPILGGASVTIRNLLDHRSGIQHYRNGVSEVNPTPMESIRNDPDVNTGFVWALSRWTALPLIFVPNTGFGYSSPAYNLLGAVVGAAQNGVNGAAGDTVEGGYLRRVNGLFAGTLAAGIRPDYHWEIESTPERSKGYFADQDLVVTEDDDTDVSWKLPSGGFHSTTEALAQYCRLLMTDQFLSDARRDEIYNASFPGGFPGKIVLGFRVDGRNGYNRVSHSGRQEKVRSRMAFYPGRQIGVVLFSNTRSRRTDEDESWWSDLFDDDAPEIDVEHLSNQLEDLLFARLANDESAVQANE